MHCRKSRSRGRTLGRIAALAGLTAALATSTAAASDAGSIGLLELAQRINPDYSCTRLQVIGLCWCGPTPCGYRVLMHVPVAFVETVRAPGDSLLAAPSLSARLAGAAGGTASSSISSTDNTSEAHVWRLGDDTVLLSRLPPCLTCKPSDAEGPPAQPQAADLPACAAASDVAAALLALGGDLTASWLPALTYASEVDWLNWRTGCRDLAGAASAALAGPACGLLHGARGEGGCLGSWGSLYPRQMRDIGTTPVVYSAKTAFRAMSIAREQLGVLPFPVDADGRMQQAYPAVSACFAVGESPLPQAPWSASPALGSADGRQGWFYWRETSCCVGFDSLQRCAGGARSR